MWLRAYAVCAALYADTMPIVQKITTKNTCSCSQGDVKTIGVETRSELQEVYHQTKLKQF